MARVVYEVNIERSICEELEEIRRMLITHDFSGLAANVERIQHHANCMESALWCRKEKIFELEEKLKQFEAGATDEPHKV